MKKLFLFLILSTFLLAGQVIELAGDKDYPPYSYSENGVAKGVYVDIIKTIFSKIDGYDVKFNMMAWKKAQVMVKKGKIIGFFPPYYSEKRSKWTKFSKPILNEKAVIFSTVNFMKGKTKFPEDFYGKTVCLNRGFTPQVMGGDKLSKAVKDKKITLVETSGNNECLNRVKRGMVDFYINDQLIDVSKFNKIKRGLVVRLNAGHIGFTLKTKKYQFINDLEAKINIAIEQIKNSGEIDRILKEYK